MVYTAGPSGDWEKKHSIVSAVRGSSWRTDGCLWFPVMTNSHCSEQSSTPKWKLLVRCLGNAASPINDLRSRYTAPAAGPQHAPRSPCWSPSLASAPAQSSLAHRLPRLLLVKRRALGRSGIPEARVHAAAQAGVRHCPDGPHGRRSPARPRTAQIGRAHV